MVNHLMKRMLAGAQAEKADERKVKVKNLSERVQFHGLYELKPGVWVDVPYDLAKRLVGDPSHSVMVAMLDSQDRPSGAVTRVNPISSAWRQTDSRIVDIIIPIHNQLAYLKTCIASIRANARHCRIITVDDGSTSDIGDWLSAQHVDEHIRHEKPLGFGRSCNAGMLASRAEWVCVLNSDTIVGPHAMSVMQSVGAIGFDIVGPTTSNSSGIQCDHTLASNRHAMTANEVAAIALRRTRDHLTDYQETDVFGFCMLIHRRVIEQIGGFDYERYADGYYEDWDYVWRAQQCGFRVVWAKGAYVHHYGHASFQDRFGWEKIHALSDRNKLMFAERKDKGETLYFPLKERVIKHGKRIACKPAG